MLHDRLVCGINHERAQQWLLSQDASLNLEKASDITLFLESANRQVVAIQRESQKRYSRRRNKKKHSVKVCQFNFFYCKNKGHVKKLCWKKTVEETVRAYSSNIAMATHQLDFSFESQPSTTNVNVIFNIEVNECYSHGSSQQCINTSAKLGHLLKD